MALVLSRRVGESIVIPTPEGLITFTIKAGRVSSQVSVAIDAPQSIEVHRKEVWDRIKEENNG